jgi:hypothetical protein
VAGLQVHTWPQEGCWAVSAGPGRQIHQGLGRLALERAFKPEPGSGGRVGPDWGLPESRGWHHWRPSWAARTQGPCGTPAAPGGRCRGGYFAPQVVQAGVGVVQRGVDGSCSASLEPSPLPSALVSSGMPRSPLRPDTAGSGTTGATPQWNLAVLALTAGTRRVVRRV